MEQVINKHSLIIILGVPLRVGLYVSSPHCIAGYPLLSLTRDKTFGYYCFLFTANTKFAKNNIILAAVVELS
jgi:hypothetical protein